MRILFIGPLPEPVTGQSLACQRLLDHLRRSHHVEVIDITKQELRQGVTSLNRIRQVLSYGRAARRMARTADVVYFTIAQSVAGTLRDHLIYRALGSKLPKTLVHLHGGAAMRELMGGANPRLAALNRRVLSRVGGVIVLGNSLRNIFEGIGDTPIHVVPNFADDDIFIDPADVRPKFETEGPLKLLFLSNLIEGKGHEELLTAVSLLNPTERARIELVFAGGFESDFARTQFMNRIADQSTVRYAGIVSGEVKRRLLHEAHIFCLPTYYRNEGQPISILEAYAAGCAVMTTLHSGIVDIFEPGANGLAVRPRDPESIAEALRAVIADQTFLPATAIRNRDSAESKYRPERFNRQIEELLENLSH